MNYPLLIFFFKKNNFFLSADKSWFADRKKQRALFLLTPAQT
jgi:hypothetical protein